MPDIYIFAIDNYVDEQKVEAAIHSGAKVMLFFRSHHDKKNTIESEVKKIEICKENMKSLFCSVKYNGNEGFKKELHIELNELIQF